MRYTLLFMAAVWGMALEAHAQYEATRYTNYTVTIINTQNLAKTIAPANARRISIRIVSVQTTTNGIIITGGNSTNLAGGATITSNPADTLTPNVFTILPPEKFTGAILGFPTTSNLNATVNVLEGIYVP